MEYSSFSSAFPVSPKEVKKTVFSKFWRGVKANHVKTQEKFQLVGFDTETCFGQVFAMGFYNGTSYKQTYGIRRNFFDDLLAYLIALPNQHKKTIVAAAHYLPFDLSVLLWDWLNPLGTLRAKAPKEIKFSVVKYRCQVTAFMGKPCFMRIRHGKVTYHVIDTFAFLGTSLAHALKTIGCKTQKLDKPKDLGKRIIPEKEVTPYLEADTKGVYELLCHIISFHQEYGARICVSLPQLAGRIFRHTCMKKDFVRLPSLVLMGSMFSYHGGKNTFRGRAGWHKKVWDLDIRSAFPEAMRQLPNFEKGRWISTEKWRDALKYPAGVYRISGFASKCPWGILFSHDFKKLEGHFINTWVTGYELAAALKCKEVKLTEFRGHYFLDDGQPSAFLKFVDDFYGLKETAKDPIKRQFYKLILNSLYGKFIQRNEKEDGTKETGGMFDPCVATLITGFVRAKIHALEHKYRSLHTATDGLLTNIRPDPTDMGEGLGQLKQENFGDCLIVRNKLYLHYDEKGQLFKRGLHGFQGNSEELLKLWTENKSSYSVSRLVKWSEAWHLGIRPGYPLEKKMKLNISRGV